MPTKTPQNPPILCIALSPAIQRTLHFSTLLRGNVNRVSKTELSAAGKGVNVARVIKTLNGRPTLIGFAGGHSGQQLKKLLKKEKLNGHWIPFNGETRHAHTLLENGHVTELVEENPSPSKKTYQDFLHLYDTLHPKTHAIILAGSPPPDAPSDLYQKIIRKAGHKLLLIDAQKTQLTQSLKARPTIVKCNREELAVTTNQKTNTQQNTIHASKSLIKNGAQAVFITDGPHPALFTDTQNTWKITPPKITPINPIGSGDATNAGLILARLQGATWPEACAYAMACGAANTQTTRPGHLTKKTINQLRKDTHIQLKRPSKNL